MKKTTLILWIVAALFLVSSIPLFTQGNIAAGVCGVVIAAILFFVGYRKAKSAPNEKREDGASTSPASTPRAASSPEAQQGAFDFLKVKVAGVTFKNGRRSRQTILRAIHFKDEPFDKGDIELSLQPYEYEGKPAFGVYVNGEQIGNVPAENTDFVNDNFSRLDGITHIEVYGGGEGRNYGAEIILRFRKQ